MPKTKVTQNNFTGGELSPYLHGRPDFPRYQSSVKKLENFIVLPHGGAIRRSGTKMAASRKNTGVASDVIRLVPFIFSEDNVFTLEFGHQYVRFFKNNAVVGAPYELTSPYTRDQVEDLDFAQSGNVMYIFHPDVQTRRLIRLTDTNWAFTTVEFYDGPYHKVGIYKDLSTPTGYTMTPSAVGTVGASITIDIKSSGVSITPFDSNDIGRHIRIYHAVGSPAVVTWGVAKITAVAVATTPQLTATVVVPFGAATASADWRASIFYGPDRWPAKGTFHGERLVWARNADYPNSFGGSVVDDYTNFSPTATDGSISDDNAYFYTLGTGQIDEIQWVQSAKVLLLGTVAGPYSVTGSDIRTPITPKAIQANKETSYGSGYPRPIFIDRASLYVSQTRKQIHEMYYSLEVDGFMTPVLSIGSEHIFRNKIKEFYPGTEPYHTVWGYTDDGKLFSITYMKDQNVIAFARHPISGTVKAICVIPTADYDQVWLAVERTISGITTIFIEYMEDIFVTSSTVAKEDAYFVDCGKQYDGVSVSSITVSHLPNTLLSVLADGGVEYVTTNGVGLATLSAPASKISIGLAYTSKLTSLPIETSTDTANTFGYLKQIKRLILNLLDSLGGKVGVIDKPTEPIEYRIGTHPMDSSSPLFDGVLAIPFPGENDRQVMLEITQDLPLPMHIRAITPELSITGE